jgi:hypothetical protein
MALSEQRSQNVPIPDPSLLTTDQLRRELNALRELLEARLDAMDKATVLLRDDVIRVPTDIDRQVTNLHAFFNERFASVARQFEQREQRYHASEEANKRAIDAALASQKEMAGAQNASNAAAIIKSEASVVKQIDSIMALMTTTTTSLNDKIGIINGRLDRTEGKSTGVSAIVAGGIAVVAVLISLFAATGVLSRGGGNHGGQGSVALTVPTVPAPPR